MACEVRGDCDTWDKHSIRHTKPLTLSTTVTMHTYSQLEMTVVHLLENFLFLASDACSQLLEPSFLYHKILSPSQLCFIPIPMTKEDKSCACPPTPKVTDPGPVLFGIGCQMATLTATAMAMGKLGSIFLLQAF